MSPVSYKPKSVNKINPKPVAPARRVFLGVIRIAAPCLTEAVAEAVPVAETAFVIVRTFGAIVVPETVVAGFVVAGTTVFPLPTLAGTV